MPSAEYRTKWFPEPQYSRESPPQSISQFELSEPVVPDVSDFPHQHSRPYSRPTYKAEAAAAKFRQASTVISSLAYELVSARALSGAKDGPVGEAVDEEDDDVDVKGRDDVADMIGCYEDNIGRFYLILSLV